jgi:hypothetical protein
MPAALTALTVFPAVKGMRIMTDSTQIHVVKKRVQAGLLSIPGVHAVGVGAKIVAGRPTKEPCIAVFLVKKRPVSQIPPSELVPPKIDGIKTDVIEMDVPRLLANHDTDRDRPVWGGSTIQAGGSPEYGTLGCIGLTTDSQPKVVAITCQHVVAPPIGTTATNLIPITPAGSPNPYTITFSGQNTSGSLVVVKMGSASKIEAYNAFYTTIDADTLQTIAKNVITQVNTLTSSAGVTATVGKQPEQVQITTDPAFDTEVKACSVYDVQSLDKGCQLFAAIANNVASTGPSCTITLSGKAGGAYAIYTSWNSDGTEPTYGSFVPVTKGTDLPTIATAIVGALTNVISKLKITGITVTSSGSQITIKGAQQATCTIKRDLRVGQATDSFSSNCSLCCTDEIGKVIAARLSVDTALVQLVSALKYVNQIKGLGSNGAPALVKGFHTVTDAEAQSQYPVMKRGSKTDKTTGTVQHINVGGYSTNSDPDNVWTVFYRFYDNAMQVQGDGGTDFGLQGDSGSAVLNNSGEVVGILFSGASGRSMVTPIDVIMSELEVNVATATDLKQVNTVTAAQGATAMSMIPEGTLAQDLRQIRAEIEATPKGMEYAELVSRHAEEVQILVNTNRRVATVWQRNGGPQILQSAIQMTQARNRRLPDEINGRSLADCLQTMRQILIRYGSRALAADLEKHGPQLIRLVGLNYQELITALQASGAN